MARNQHSSTHTIDQHREATEATILDGVAAYSKQRFFSEQQLRKVFPVSTNRPPAGRVAYLREQYELLEPLGLSPLD